jgi:hypothetical protein
MSKADKENELLFKMFVCEWMGWSVSAAIILVFENKSSLAFRLYEALKEE